MKTITINGSFKDTIERIVFCKKYKPSEVKEVYFNNETNREDLLKGLKDCISFTIDEDNIICKVYRSEEEKQKDINHFKEVLKSNIYQLKKWCNLKEEYKTQITEYLECLKLDWILNKLNK